MEKNNEKKESRRKAASGCVFVGLASEQRVARDGRGGGTVGEGHKDNSCTINCGRGEDNYAKRKHQDSVSYNERIV